ncbi:MAG: IS1380 family transposase [Gammaproteobacteria bacterium]|nr:IS1380 family transposase [Gammaproteobacteria bacterium]
MVTECNPEQLHFDSLGRREVVAKFDGGQISSDGGALLLREVEQRTGILESFSRCFTDYRDPELIEHTVGELVAQRVIGLALGYEDLNDHDELRLDQLLAVVVGKADPTGSNRLRAQDRGKPLAGKSTLNRLELTPADANEQSRYQKIVAHPEAIDRLFIERFVESHREAPERIVLDLDATDDPLHGKQEGRFFHGYYGQYCYLPLYIFCGDHLLCARLRRSNIDASAGAVEELERIVAEIRRHWPSVEIVIRGDSGFCREEIMAWCEGNGVRYVLGLAKNERLRAALGEALAQAQARYEQTGQAARVFTEFSYQTLESWSQARRVIGKAEYLAKGANPRFVVTDLRPEEMDARRLYEDEYCARGDMENRIKEQQLALFADRTSTATMRANQTRLYFSSMAYVLLEALQDLGLSNTELAKAQSETIRLKLLKIGAQVRITVRKVWLSLSQSYPYAALFRQVHENLRHVPLRC